MGHLVIYSESGVPHSGCVLQYGNTVEWLSFMPRSGSFFNVIPGGNYGMVDTTDRADAIDTYVSMWVSDDDLVKGRNDTLANYYAATYGLLINDCINFSREMVKNCKLTGGNSVSFTPGIFVIQLNLLNQDRIQSYNTKPYPWENWKPAKAANSKKN